MILIIKKILSIAMITSVSNFTFTGLSDPMSRNRSTDYMLSRVVKVNFVSQVLILAIN